MSETNTEITQNRSEDEILQSVSDEYIRKRKRKRIISLSIISAIVFALSVIIITLACVKVDLKPFFIEEASSYQVVIKGNTTKTYVSGDENYDEFYDLYLNTFQTSYLTGIFTGALGAYTVEETTQDFYSSYENGVGSGMSSYLKNLVGDNYIRMHFGVDQRIYNADGSICYSKRNSSAYELRYNDVYFSINTEDKDSELTFYFGAYCYADEEVKVKPRITKITIRANTYALYDYIQNN